LSQILAGSFIGLPPGAVPGVTAPVLDLLGTTAPSSSSDPSVSTCSIGSRFTNVAGVAGGILFVKVAANTWTAIA
jgi:hypothetical protein